MIVRHRSNPIIRPSDVKPSLEGYKVLGVFNPGATNFGDEIILLLRVAKNFFLGLNKLDQDYS